MRNQSNVTRAFGVLVAAGFAVAISSPAKGVMQLDGGKKAAYNSAATAALTTSASTLVTVTLQKGKKKNVLEVDGTVVETSNSATAIAATVRVNGIVGLMEPTQ